MMHRVFWGITTIETLYATWAVFQANYWLYLSMPVTSAVIGYATNVLAIRMMFHPVKFVGIPPIFGWQGIVPRKAGKMAEIACDTLVPKLISKQEIFSRLDPERVAKEIEQPMFKLLDRITEEVMTEYEPTLWVSLPMMVKRRISERLRAEAPEVIADMMIDIQDEVDTLFDLREMVISHLVREPELLNTIFLETGKSEFDFIGRSGAYFGLAFGTLQMLVWLFYPAQWVLPAFGLLVGYATNWVALRLIFHPKKPIKVGPWVIQGLFLKRQDAVAQDYGRLIADQIVTPHRIFEAVLRGPHADRMFEMISHTVKRVIDEQAGIARPFVAWTVGTRDYLDMKAAAAERIVAQLPQTLRHVERYAEDAMQIRETLASRLRALPTPEFEAMLRPAFQEDEWLLIAVGAALGALVGTGQLALFLALGSGVLS